MTIKETVEFILQNHPKIRGSDKLLLQVYRQLYSEWVCTAEFIDNHYWFIVWFVRIRAKFQQHWLYIPNEFVWNRRKVREKEMRALYSLPITEATGKKIEQKEIKQWFFEKLISKFR